MKIVEFCPKAITLFPERVSGAKGEATATRSKEREAGNGEH